MNPHIEKNNKKGDMLSFTLSGVNVSLANAIRRTILSDIPILVFKTTPYEENCQQLGPNYDSIMAKLEAKTLIKQLERQFPKPEGVYYTIKSNPHDFGYYYSVRLVYDDNDENHQEFVNKVEDNFPKNWDEQSLLTLEEYKLKGVI